MSISAIAQALSVPGFQASDPEAESTTVEPAIRNDQPIGEDAIHAPHDNGVASRFARLPNEVVDRILQYSDPLTFASLSLLNSQWWRRSRFAPLLKLQIARADSQGQDEPNGTDTSSGDTFEDLRKRFLTRVQEGLYPSYRSAHHSYKLSIPLPPSATLFETAKRTHCTFSPRGNWVLWVFSMQIFIIEITEQEPVVRHILSSNRVPKASFMADEGKQFALLYEGGQVDVYKKESGWISGETYKVSKSSLVDASARSIAMSPDCKLAVVSCDNALQLVALVDKPTIPTRKIAACSSDIVRFSDNGMIIVAGSRGVKRADTTVVHAPMPDYGGEEEEEEESAGPSLDQLWMSQPLFPKTFDSSSHLTFLNHDPLRLLAWDNSAGAFGVLDVEDLNFLDSGFVLPRELTYDFSGASLPLLDASRRLAAMTFRSRGVLLGSIGQLNQEDGIKTEEESEVREPIPLHFNGMNEHFIAGSFLRGPSGTTKAGISRKLVVVSSIKGTNSEDLEEGEEEDPSTDVGRIIVLDWRYHAVAHVQPEKVMDLASARVQAVERHVDIPDPQTPTDRRPMNAPIARSVTSARRRPRQQETEDAPPLPKKHIPATAENESGEVMPSSSFLDAAEPYAPNEPRSGDSLQRAATAVAANRAGRPEMPSAVPSQPQIRQARSRNELPDESDADNWVPPPPAYVKDPESDTPNPPEQPLMNEQSLQQQQIPRESRSSPSLSTHRQDTVVQESIPQPPGQVSSQAEQSPVEPASAKGNDKTQAEPLAVPRRRQQGVRSMVGNARNSMVMTASKAKRIVSDNVRSGIGDDRPQNDDQGASSTPQRDVRQAGTTDGAGSSSQKTTPNQGAVTPNRQMDSDQTTPSNLAERPPSSRRHTFASRPLSMNWSSSPFRHQSNTSQASLQHGQQTPPLAGAPSAPESPKYPHPDQISSLHRRQTSTSMASVHSDDGSQGMAPRAAVGARRIASGERSPWASSVMLGNINEQSDRTYAPYSPAPSNYSSRPQTATFESGPTSSGTSKGPAQGTNNTNQQQFVRPPRTSSRIYTDTNINGNRTESPNPNQGPTRSLSKKLQRRESGRNKQNEQSSSKNSRDVTPAGQRDEQSPLPRWRSPESEAEKEAKGRRRLSSIQSVSSVTSLISSAKSRVGAHSNGSASNVLAPVSEDRQSSGARSTDGSNGNKSLLARSGSRKSRGSPSPMGKPKRKNTIKRRVPAYANRLDDVAEDEDGVEENPAPGKKGKSCIVM